jgi:hypothetical protein
MDAEQASTLLVFHQFAVEFAPEMESGKRASPGDKFTTRLK